MELLTDDQAAKIATHISEAVAQEVAASVDSFRQQMTANSQHLEKMSQQYAQMGVNLSAADDQAKADMMEAANKLVLSRYAGHGYFYPRAGWTKDQFKVRNAMIEKAKDFCPARLDQRNTTDWFNRVFTACAQIPEVKGGQIADVMWSAMPEDQAAIWLPEVKAQLWTGANPEAVLQTMIEQFVGADPAGSNAIRQYLDFRPTKNETYTTAWHRFTRIYTSHFSKTALPSQPREFSQVCNQFVMNWPDHDKKSRILDVLNRFPPLHGKPLMRVVERLRPLEVEARYTNNRSGAAR